MSTASHIIDLIKALQPNPGAPDQLRQYAQALAEEATFAFGEESSAIYHIGVKAGEFGIGDDSEIQEAIKGIEKVKQEGGW